MTDARMELKSILGSQEDFAKAVQNPHSKIFQLEMARIDELALNELQRLRDFIFLNRAIMQQDKADEALWQEKLAKIIERENALLAAAIQQADEARKQFAAKTALQEEKKSSPEEKKIEALDVRIASLKEEVERINTVMSNVGYAVQVLRQDCKIIYTDRQTRLQENLIQQAKIAPLYNIHGKEIDLKDDKLFQPTDTEKLIKMADLTDKSPKSVAGHDALKQHLKLAGFDSGGELVSAAVMISKLKETNAALGNAISKSYNMKAEEKLIERWQEIIDFQRKRKPDEKSMLQIKKEEAQAQIAEAEQTKENIKNKVPDAPPLKTTAQDQKSSAPASPVIVSAKPGPPHYEPDSPRFARDLNAKNMRVIMSEAKYSLNAGVTNPDHKWQMAETATGYIFMRRDEKAWFTFDKTTQAFSVDAGSPESVSAMAQAFKSAFPQQDPVVGGEKAHVEKMQGQLIKANLQPSQQAVSEKAATATGPSATEPSVTPAQPEAEVQRSVGLRH